MQGEFYYENYENKDKTNEGIGNQLDPAVCGKQNHKCSDACRAAKYSKWSNELFQCKILFSKVSVEEPHKLKIKHLKAIVIFVLVLNIGMALVNPAILLYIYSNSMEAFESAVFKVNLAVGAVSNILRVIICYRVLVSKAEFDVQEEAGKV